MSLATIAALWTLCFGPPFENWNRRSFDLSLQTRFKLDFIPPVNSQIVHIGIEYQDLQAFTSVESEYAAIARCLTQLSQLGAKVVAFDAIFTRGSSSQAQPILQAIAQAQQNGTTVILAEGNVLQNTFQRLRSFPWLTERHKPSGWINLPIDPDGVYRRYSYVTKTTEGLEPSLALATYLSWMGSLTTLRQSNPHEAEWLEVTEDGTPISKRISFGPLWPNFRCNWLTRNHPAAITHLNLRGLEKLGAQNKERPLKGKIVLVSYTAPTLGDLGPTPLGNNQPLVTLHLTALNDLLQGSYCRRTSYIVDSLGLFSLGGIGFVAGQLQNRRKLLFLAISGIAILWIGGWILVWHYHFVPPTASALFLWVIMTIAELGRLYSMEFLDRLKLQTSMSFYFSPRVFQQVLTNPGCMEPKEATMTVLLTDLRNSTPLAERLGTRKMFELLNQVFEAQTTAVLSHDGSMEHFLGDQFLSYWGAPDPQPDASERAFNAAGTLIENMEQLRQNLSPEVRELFGYGVALHRGVGLVGNKGSRQRLDYGLVGDFINAAARVESLTKYYGVLFLITREVAQDLSRPMTARLIDRVIVKGKSQPLELLETKNCSSRPNFAYLCHCYDEAFAHYERAQFQEAQRRWARLIEEHNDPPSKILSSRCEELLKEPPDNWTGTYALSFK